MRLALIRLLALASLLFIISPALAVEPANPSFRMRYLEPQSPAPCSGNTLLREELRMRMGYDPFRDDADDEVTVTVTLREDNLVGNVEARNAEGKLFSRRVFSFPNHVCGCYQLLLHVASSIEFTFMPIVINKQEPAPPPVCPTPTPARTVPSTVWDELPPPRPPPPKPPAPRAADEARPPVEIGIGALGGGGTAEEAFAGGYGLFRVRWPSLSLALEGRLLRFASRERALREATEPPDPDVPRDPRDPPVPPASVVTGWRRTRGVLAVAFVPCVHGRRVFGCGVLEAGSLLFSERAPDKPRSAHRSSPGVLLLGAGLRAGAELPVSPALSFHAFTELLSMFMPLNAELADVEATLTSGLTVSLGAGALVGF